MTQKTETKNKTAPSKAKSPAAKKKTPVKKKPAASKAKTSAATKKAPLKKKVTPSKPKTAPAKKKTPAKKKAATAKKKIAAVPKKTKENERFEAAYFENYMGTGIHYDQCYGEYTGVVDCIQLLKKQPEIFDSISSVIVTGVGSDRVLEHLRKELNANVYGCEISKYAYERMYSFYQAYVENMDLRDYLAKLVEEKKHFDLCYSAAFMYLDEKDIPTVLENTAKTCKYLFMNMQYAGSRDFFLQDPERSVSQPREWWIGHLAEAGFRPVASARFRWKEVELLKSTVYNPYLR
ncbi:MAG: class I SAM-dependent methyltransferase [Alphaproteobacteria bacterium]